MCFCQKPETPWFRHTEEACWHLNLERTLFAPRSDKGEQP